MSAARPLIMLLAAVWLLAGFMPGSLFAAGAEGGTGMLHATGGVDALHAADMHGTDALDHHGHHDHGAGETTAPGRFSLRDLPASLDTGEALLIVFFVFMLLLSGVVLWGVLVRSRTEELKRTIGNHVLQLQRILFLAVAANLGWMLWLRDGLSDFFVIRTLAREQAGLAWMTLLVMSLLGLFLLGRNKLFDVLWLFLVVAATTRLGHADLSLDLVLSSLLSGIHLLAAALWIGGLYKLLAMRNRFRYDAERLAPNVLNASLAAMILLFVSGLANSAMYLPDLGLLTHTRWGWILVVKTALFAVLILLTLLLRRRGVHRAGAVLKLKFAVVLLVSALSAVMPVSSPIPHGEPLHWHEMGEEVHMTAEIAPLSRGGNDYRVTVWLPEGSGPPRSVEMDLFHEDAEEPDHTIPLMPATADTDLHFVGFADYYYAASGDHMDRPGRWTVRVRIVEDGGRTWTFANHATVY